MAVFLITCLIAVLGFRTPVQAYAASPTFQQSTTISPIFTREVQYWADDITRWANAAGIDPNLAAAVMQIESCGDPRAVSRAGAKGLFQVMPFHFALGDNPFDPKTNALRGLKYLARSVQAANGDARLALAGYNGGIGVISRYEWTWAAETRRYIYYSLPIYEDARSGKTSSSMLEEWYRKYGAGLCRQAGNRLGITP
jgi:soluble lytic murein transglycosylase-like protein